MGFAAIQEDIWAQVETLSRTAVTGVVDFASAEEKRSIVAGPLASDFNARSSFLDAISYLDRSPSISPQSLSTVNRLLTGGSVHTPGGLRSFNSPHFPYIDHRLVPRALQGACAHWERMPPAIESECDAVNALAEVHWHVNLHGHFFADGCGRTAVVFGSWLTWTRYDVFFSLPSRERYLELGSARRFTDFRDSFAATIAAAPR
jgi:hypothetical protein